MIPGRKKAVLFALMMGWSLFTCGCSPLLLKALLSLVQSIIGVANAVNAPAAPAGNPGNQTAATTVTGDPALPGIQTATTGVPAAPAPQAGTTGGVNLGALANTLNGVNPPPAGPPPVTQTNGIGPLATDGNTGQTTTPPPTAVPPAVPTAPATDPKAAAELQIALGRANALQVLVIGVKNVVDGLQTCNTPTSNLKTQLQQELAPLTDNAANISKVVAGFGPGVQLADVQQQEKALDNAFAAIAGPTSGIDGRDLNAVSQLVVALATGQDTAIGANTTLDRVKQAVATVRTQCK